MKREEIRIDCFGHPTSKDVRVQLQGEEVHFHFVNALASSPRSSIGLYIDYTATTARLLGQFPKFQRVALLSEPNASLPFVDTPTLKSNFAFVLTHDKRLLERGVPYTEFPFGTSFVEEVLDANASDFPKTKLVSHIGAHHPDPKAGHVLRNQVISTLLSRSDVDCFGKDVKWIDSKLEGLRDYAFSIAIENCSRDYYFSEKIIDCFLTYTVPIYCGMPSITKYFDAKGLIQFSSLIELEAILEELSWEKYRRMLPHVLSNREIAISNRWGTRNQLFDRVAQKLFDYYPNLHVPAPITLQLHFQRLKQKLRSLLRSSSKS